MSADHTENLDLELGVRLGFVLDTPGLGSTFSIILPLVDEKQSSDHKYLGSLEKLEQIKNVYIDVSRYNNLSNSGSK